MIQNREVQSEIEASTGNPPEPFVDANNNLSVRNKSDPLGPQPIDSSNLTQGNGMNSIFTVPILGETMTKLWSSIKSQNHLPPLLAISFAVILLMQVCTFLTEAFVIGP